MPSPTTQEQPSFLTIPQAAQQLQVNDYTIRRMISKGHLKAVRVGRLIRIRPEDLNRALKPVTTFTSGGEAVG